MAYGLSNGHVADDVTWPWKVKLVTPIRLERNISKTTELLSKTTLQIWYAALYRECLEGAQIIFPESGRGLHHVALQFLAYDRTYLQNCLSYRLRIW